MKYKIQFTPWNGGPRPGEEMLHNDHIRLSNGEEIPQVGDFVAFTDDFGAGTRSAFKVRSRYFMYSSASTCDVVMVVEEINQDEELSLAKF